METRVRANEVLGKTVISEETGKKFGVVGNIDFVTESGELLNIIIDQPTGYVKELTLKTNEKGKFLIPFSAVKSIGDFVIVSESELV